MKGYFSGGKSCCISDCLSSSRLNTIRRRGLYCAIAVLIKCLPKLPVPPVTSTDFSFRSIQGWVKSRSGAHVITGAAAEISDVARARAGDGLMPIDPVLAGQNRSVVLSSELTVFWKYGPRERGRA